MGFEVRAGIPVSIITLPVSGKQLTASNTAQPHKVRMPRAGRVVGIVGYPGTLTYGTIPTDMDVTVRKGTTALHSDPVPVINSSTIATTEALLSPTLTVTRASKKFSGGDYLSAEVEFTGGSTITLDGDVALVAVVWE